MGKYAFNVSSRASAENALRVGMWLIAALLLMLIGACGGGSSSTPNVEDSPSVTAHGVFLDSAVEGIRYESGSLSGYTDSSGGFEYEPGHSVTFHVGDILVGEATGKAVVTPVDLVAGASDQTHPTVTNICMFLQSLDDDGDPSNGISISRLQDSLAEGKSIDFAQSIAAFASDGNVLTIVAEMTAVSAAGARGLVSAESAQSHMEKTLFNRLAGNYSGTYTGSGGGTWSVVVSNTGVITGSGVSNMYGDFDVAGTVSSDGNTDFTSGIVVGEQVGSVFAGKFDADNGAAFGVWEGGCCESGTWSGSRQ